MQGQSLRRKRAQTLDDPDSSASTRAQCMRARSALSDYPMGLRNRRRTSRLLRARNCRLVIHDPARTANDMWTFDDNAPLRVVRVQRARRRHECEGAKFLNSRRRKSRALDREADGWTQSGIAIRRYRASRESSLPAAEPTSVQRSARGLRNVFLISKPPLALASVVPRLNDERCLLRFLPWISPP